MYYYQHHIGDLMRETANLNDHQLVTYLRLIWRYYDTEKPIQGDLEDIAFAVRSDEKTVRLLLRHYFVESNNVWTNKRCDEEIAAYHAKVKKAKESANARWSNANALPTNSERNANANESDANQEPITNNQKPIKNKKQLSAPPPDLDFELAWSEYPKRPGASKAESLKAWKARLNAGAKPADLIAGVRRYAAYVVATHTEPKFIKQPSTFFGPGDFFLADWTVPAQARASPSGAPMSRQQALIAHNAQVVRDWVPPEMRGEGVIYDG